MSPSERSGDRASSAAAHILRGTDAGLDPSDPARATLEHFYSLVVTLPDAVDPRIDATPVVPGAQDGGHHNDRRTRIRAARVGGITGGRVTGPGGRVTPRPRRVVRVPLAGFIALVAALVFTVVLLLVPRPAFAPSDALYLTGTGAARAARGYASADGSELVVFASGLSELEQGYRYVVWEVTDDSYRRLGTLTTLADLRARLTIQRDQLPAQIEVTIEPSTATGDPSGPAVLAGFTTAQ